MKYENHRQSLLNFATLGRSGKGLAGFIDAIALLQEELFNRIRCVDIDCTVDVPAVEFVFETAVDYVVSTDLVGVYAFDDVFQLQQATSMI